MKTDGQDLALAGQFIRQVIVKNEGSNVTKIIDGQGLTKREYFASAILQGLCSFDVAPDNHGDVYAQRARAAVLQADVLIEHLNSEFLS